LTSIDEHELLSSPQFSELQQPSHGAGGFGSGLIGNNSSENREIDDHTVFIFKSQLEIDGKIERAKVQLSLKTDFNLIDAFRIFD